jgi:hypothetical protein
LSYKWNKNVFHIPEPQMKTNTPNSKAIRLQQWVENTRLNKTDLAEKLEYPRNSLYRAMDTGELSDRLLTAISEHFPETDLNWLIKGEYSQSSPIQNLAEEPAVPFNRIDRAKTAAVMVERDLLKAQLRTAAALESLAGLFEVFLKQKPAKGKK